METSFYSQNTGRFYPFDEDKVQEKRHEYSEKKLEFIRKAIVDIGMVVTSSDRRLLPVQAFCKIRKIGDDFKVSLLAYLGNELPSELEESELERNYLEGRNCLDFSIALADLQDFITIKAVCGDCYGYITVGIASIWTDNETAPLWEDAESPNCIPFSELPVHRGCIRCLNRQFYSLEIVNEDRYLPTDECLPSQTDRPERWTYGSIRAGDITLKSGYNCELQFSELDNTIWIYPLAYAGLGKVEKPIPLGFQRVDVEDHRVWEKEQMQTESGRYDTVNPNTSFAASVAGAYGNEVLVETDHHFRTGIFYSEGFCGEQCLLIECLYTEETCPPITVLENPHCE